MRRLLLLALLTLACCLPKGAPAKPMDTQDWFPVKKGARWTYAVTGTLKKVATIEVTGDGAATWDGLNSRLQPTPDGLVVLVTRHVGIAGLPKEVPLVDLRWSGPATWKTYTFEGCIRYEIEGARTGTDRIATPAGTYDTVKVTNTTLQGVDAYWIAKGIGIVQRERTGRNQSLRWTLSKVSIP